MASIINALFGHHKDKDDKKHNEKVETATTTTTTTAGSSSGSSVAHTAISDDVRVHSVVSSESNTSISMQNAKKITDLMNKLGKYSFTFLLEEKKTKQKINLVVFFHKKGTTHQQVDEYSKKRTAEISEAVASAIEKVVSETATQQQKLLSDANERSAAIEIEYKQRLQERVAQLDADKAVLLAELERTLNERQEAILLKARENIDAVQNAANQEKLAVFKEAQAKANQQVDQITEQVAGLAAEDAQRRLQSTTQTVCFNKNYFFFFLIVFFYLLNQVITTKAVASGETHVPGTNVASISTTTTTANKSSESYQTSQSSSSNH